MTTILEEEEIISEEDRETMQDEWNMNWYNTTRLKRTSSRKQKSKKKQGTHHLPPPNPPPIPPITQTPSPKSPPIKHPPMRVPMVSQEEPVAPPTPPRRFRCNLPSFQCPRSAAFISQEALNSVIAKGYLESPTWSVQIY